MREEAVVIFVVCALHANTLWNGMVWDDKAAVVLNGDVWGPPHLWSNDYWGQPMSAVDSHKSWRPLATLTFRWNYQVHGFEPLGYHAVNVVLHALACVFALRVCRRVDERAGLAAAVLFAAHPIHTEPVASVVGRADVLCGCLVLAALDAYLAGRFWIAHVLSVLAALAKEIGVSASALFVAFDLVDFWTTQTTVRLWRPCVAVASFLAVVFLHISKHGERLVYQWTVLENSVATLDHDKLLTYAYLHVVYFSKLLAPWRLCYDYGYPCIPHVQGWRDARNVWTLLLYSGLVGTGVRALAVRDKRSLACLALTLVPFVPASQIFLEVGTILGERLLYLPSLGYCLSLARLLWPRTTTRRGRLAALIFVCSLATRTVTRNLAWRNERDLFEAAMAVCPTSLKVLNNLALVLLTEEPKDLPRANALLTTALDIHPTFRSAAFNRGLVNHLSGRRVAAIVDFERALSLDSSDVRAHTYLGQELWLLARTAPKLRESLLAQADDHLDRGDPSLPLTAWARASVALDTHRHRDAVQYGRAAIDASNRAADPKHKLAPGAAYNLLGLALRGVGDDQAALDAFDTGLGTEPTHFDLLANTASLHADLGNLDDAAALYDRALEQNPASPHVLNNFGYFHEYSLNDLHRALDLYTQARDRLLPDSHPQIDTNIANLNARLGAAPPSQTDVAVDDQLPGVTWQSAS